MYETIWDDILNSREIDKIEETNFETNITMVSGTENTYNNFFIWEYQVLSDKPRKKLILNLSYLSCFKRLLFV
jgi:hypothetical protein